MSNEAPRAFDPLRVGTPYMVKARVGDDVAANIVLVTSEFEKNASDDTFREMMRSSVADIVEERCGKDAEYELTWVRGGAASIALS